MHTVIATIKAWEALEAKEAKEAKEALPVMPVIETIENNVMPIVIDVMPTIVDNVMPTADTIEKNISSITKKDVDIVTSIVDNGINGITDTSQEKTRGQLSMFEPTLEERVLANEKAIAELRALVMGGKPQQSTLNRVKIKPPRDAAAPGNYKSYTVNYGNGNYRLIKRVNGKLRCIHVGRAWSESAADAALARWEAKV